MRMNMNDQDSGDSSSSENFFATRGFTSGDDGKSQHGDYLRSQDPSTSKRISSAVLITKSKTQPKKKDKNPNNLTTSDVAALIKGGQLVTGLPPEKRRCTADHWGDSMWFLYEKATGNELEHWYLCIKCCQLFNTVLADGTKGIRDHAQKHKLDGKYEFDRYELASLLTNATSFGATNGSASVEEITRKLPLPHKWYGFIQNLRIFNPYVL